MENKNNFMDYIGYGFSILLLLFFLLLIVGFCVQLYFHFKKKYNKYKQKGIF
jgi:flagellar basal body-associated protein FliL